MISRIKISNIASYDESGIEFSLLEKFNFFYGNNGSGKSTLSKILNSPEEFQHCEIVNENTEYQTLVYNKDFITKHFSESHEIPGIFTLGKEVISIQEQIKEKNDKINHINMKLPSIVAKLETNKHTLENLEESFKERAWELKKKYDDTFSEVLVGSRGSKAAFTQTLISKIESLNETDDLILDVLQEKSKTLFKQTHENKLPLTSPDIGFIEKSQNNIFEEKIIGKQDLDISHFIQELKIDDWVSEGIKHLHSSSSKCPFCQQKLPDTIALQLEEYFDRTYHSKLESLKKIKDTTSIAWKILINFLESLEQSYEDLIEKKELTSLIFLTKNQLLEFDSLVNKKINEPSLVLTTPNYEDYLNELTTYLNRLQTKIDEYNKIIENLGEEKRNLATKVWDFLALEIKADYDDFIKQRKIYLNTINGLSSTIDTNKENIINFKNEILYLKSSVTGVDESVKNINSQLKVFGFTNFHLSTTLEKGVYKILRPNGDVANETLSEGEKTFITFLYYYNLVFGNTSPDEENSPKILVIDDPISSLDSKVLFIVSTLIQQLIYETNKTNSLIKQIFVLTHNTYFFKEVTNRVENECTFHILSKRDNVTRLISYEDNPIKNSYQLLWEELNMSLDNSISVSQNIMRRILENYFSFTGNMRLSSLTSYFEGDEILIYKSLISWLHDGSHSNPDDLFISVDPELKHIYFKVFKYVFVKSGHDAHFEMMVNTTFSEESKLIFVNSTDIASYVVMN